jgi:hypothetical protein
MGSEMWISVMQHKEKTKNILSKALLSFDSYLLFEFIFTTTNGFAAQFGPWLLLSAF